jgi:hypothetical protein
VHVDLAAAILGELDSVVDEIAKKSAKRGLDRIDNNLFPRFSFRGRSGRDRIRDVLN